MTLPHTVPGHDAGGGTRDRLLDSAEKLFAQRGFLATSVRDITADAGCNVAAVNYHFGGKDNLYREMFRRRLATVRERRMARLRDALDRMEPAPSLETVLRSITGAFLEPLVAPDTGRWFLQLLSREMVERRLPADIFFDEMVEPTNTTFAEAIRKACPHLDVRAARLCIQSLVAQLTHAVHLSNLLESVAPRRGFPTTLPKIIEHVVRFSAGGVRAYLEEPAP